MSKLLLGGIASALSISILVLSPLGASASDKCCQPKICDDPCKPCLCCPENPEATSPCATPEDEFARDRTSRKKA